MSKRLINNRLSTHLFRAGLISCKHLSNPHFYKYIFEESRAFDLVVQTDAAKLLSPSSHPIEYIVQQHSQMIIKCRS